MHESQSYWFGESTTICFSWYFNHCRKKQSLWKSNEIWKNIRKEIHVVNVKISIVIFCRHCSFDCIHTHAYCTHNMFSRMHKAIPNVVLLPPQEWNGWNKEGIPYGENWIDTRSDIPWHVRLQILRIHTCVHTHSYSQIDRISTLHMHTHMQCTMHVLTRTDGYLLGIRGCLKLDLNHLCYFWLICQDAFQYLFRNFILFNIIPLLAQWTDRNTLNLFLLRNQSISR